MGPLPHGGGRPCVSVCAFCRLSKRAAAWSQGAHGLLCVVSTVTPAALANTDGGNRRPRRVLAVLPPPPL